MAGEERREKKRITFYLSPTHRFMNLLKGNSLILNHLLDSYFGTGVTEEAQTKKLLMAKDLLAKLKREGVGRKKPPKKDNSKKKKTISSAPKEGESTPPLNSFQEELAVHKQQSPTTPYMPD